MGFELSGYVLRPARTATGNARSTGEATSGVSRDHIEPAAMTSLGYDIAPTRLVEPYADMYRAAVIGRPDGRTGTDEYIVWAATTGSLSTVESDSFVLLGDPAAVVVSVGALPVTGGFTDGTDTFFVEDVGGRDLSTVKSLTLVRGDTGAFSVITVFEVPQDPLIGRVVLTSTTLTTFLDGGFSPDRGDVISQVTYILSSPKFWWSRNDNEVLRFGWDGKTGRWAPFQGGLPQDLGAVDEEGNTYELVPPVSRFAVGDVLPGESGAPEGFSLLRAGVYPDSTAKPLDVLVVSDADVEGDYPVAGTTYDAVVGVANGLLLLNPATFAPANAGLTLWYNPESFRPGASGDIGGLATQNLASNQGFPVLSPIPGPTERPFVRIGFRRYLTPIAVDIDDDLPDDPTGVAERSFVWSRATGKTVFAAADIRKSIPGDSLYDIAYLEARLYYDGVSMSTQPVPGQLPAPCVNSSGSELIGVGAGGDGVPGTGDIFIQRASALPPPGTSGVLFVADGTGDAPALGSPQTRPNDTGLTRVLRGVGDSFLFAGSKAFEELIVEEYEKDIPKLKIKVKKTEAVTSRLASASAPLGFLDASRVQLKRRKIKGEALYFLQAQVMPSVYSDEARLFARFGGPYTLVGTEVLEFAIDGNIYTWDAATNLSAGGTFTATEIAADLNLAIAAGAGVGTVVVIRNRVAIQAPLDVDDVPEGTVEIGWNPDADNLTGHSALGFLPGWRVDTAGGIFRWQPDNGAAVGLYRSPENLDREARVADIKAVGKFRSRVLTDNIPGTPFFNVTNPPLEDIPGYDDGVHFVSAQGFNFLRLSNYGITQGVGLKYDFINDRITWVEKGTTRSTAVLAPSDILQLDHQNVLPETVSRQAMGPNGAKFGLYLKDVGDAGFSELALGEDFIMPGGGAPGQAQLITPEGNILASGGGGTFTSGIPSIFSNPELSPNPTQDLVLQMDLLARVDVGDLLQLLNGPTEAQGVYTITSKAFVGGTAEFNVTPSFPVTGVGVAWRAYEAQTPDVFDPTLIADVKQVVFNHFPEEPWKIRLLSSTGLVGAALTAVVSDALASNRVTLIRFGQTQPPLANEATITYLERGAELGTVRASGLLVPDLADVHFTNSTAIPDVAYFALRLGSTEFSTTAGNLEMVSAFPILPAVIPPGEVWVGIDGSGIDGEIQIADDLVANFAAETVVYDQLFLAALDLAPGTAEIEPSTGSVSLSSADLATYAGETAYYVEQMVTEFSQDVVISPLNGSILFNKPLRGFQLVETEYIQADPNGDPVLDDSGNPVGVVEYLPLTVRLEEATLVSPTIYAFNPTGRTLGARGDEFIWVGVELQNFAGATTATVNDNSTITLNTEPAGAIVQLNYGVLEAFGGEQAYTVSTVPVYRKPFFLLEEQSTFALETDRTADIEVGLLGVVGDIPLYVKAVSYDAGANETTVEIWPPPLTEAGSRAPGRDAGFTLTDIRVAITIDPAGTPVAGGGNSGFLLVVDQSDNPMLPADRGQLEVTFSGNLTRYAQAGHLLEIAGYPYLVIGGELSEDGRFTNVGLANPIYTGHSSADLVCISVRPIYIPDPVEFVGISPFVESEGFTLFILGITNSSGTELPGRQLTEGVHYEVDPGTGAVSFKTPSQGPLKPGERLVAAYTALDPIGPAVVDGAVLSPFYNSQYLYVTLPSDLNRILGATLAAKYTFRNPDTFYYETVPIDTYLGEVAGVALSKVSSSSRSGGPAMAFPGTPDNSAQGSLGLRSEIHDLQNLDLAARAYIELYNGVVLAFEQILEVFDARIIGDRDGKFRFFIGHNKRYPPPGYQDDITGEMNQRLVWREVVNKWATATAEGTALLAGGYYTETDPVYDPNTAEEKDPTDRPGETDGKTVNSNNLAFYTQDQKGLVKNDMDDRVLVGLGRPRGLFGSIFPGINIPGEFKGMWEAHAYSRLFPERSKHFTRLFPGLEAEEDPATGGFTDPGFYSSGRKITTDGPSPGETTKSIIKTRKSTIGMVANPALGTIRGLVEVTASDRLPRARIWRYYPEGDADLDASVGSTSVGIATIVATPLPLSEFPLKADGFPDETQLISAGPPSSLSDLVSGDPALSTPGFVAGQRLQFGTPQGPTGITYELTDSNGNGIFVKNVQAGCVLTLMDRKGNDVTGSDVLVNEEGTLGDYVSGETGRGDTIFGGQPIPDLEELLGDDESPTLEQQAELALSLPDYRIQFDLKVAKRTGEFQDASLPTRDDVFPLPLQNMFGQKPPLPLTCIEGDVEFANTSRVPLKLPALLGQNADDSGDVQIPYLGGAGDTELSLLGEVASQFTVLLGSDSAAAPYFPPGAPADEGQIWGAIYPNETVFTDGTIFAAATITAVLPSIGPPAPADSDRDPGVLYSNTDMRPVATAGAYTADSAIGDARKFDLLFVETEQPQAVAGEIKLGMTGILSIGDVRSNNAAPGLEANQLSEIETPRFVSLAKRTSLHRYTATNVWARIAGAAAPPAGLEVTEVIGAFVSTAFDASTAGPVVFSDGVTVSPGAGGILPLIPGNAVVINIYDPDPLAGAGLAFLGSIILTATAPGGTIYVWDALTSTSTPVVLDLFGTGVTIAGVGLDSIAVDTTGSLLALLTGVAGGAGTFYDYSVTVDTYFDANTVLIAPTLGLGAGAGSTSCEIGRDRLTFNERISFRAAKARGLKPANGDLIEIGVTLDVQRITTSGTADCSVNESSETNDGDPFTILERVGPPPDGDITFPAGALYVGSFISGPAGTENGQVKVMSWEGNGNLALPFSVDPTGGIKAAAVPTSDLNEAGVILEAEGTMRDSAPGVGLTLDGTQNWIEQVTAGGGSLANPEAGDIVAVDRGTSDEGASKTGTYLVRHAIDSNAASLTDSIPLLAGTYANDAGSRRFLDLTFPSVKSSSGLTLVLEGVAPVRNTTEGCGFPTGDGVTTFVYLVVENTYSFYDLTSTEYTINKGAVYRMAYTGTVSYDGTARTATFTLATGTAQEADGGVITDAVFLAAAARGLTASGMLFFPVNPREDTGLPENNVVGFQESTVAGDLTAGFRVVVGGNLRTQNHGGNSGTTVTTRVWDKIFDPAIIRRLFADGTSTGGTDAIGVRVPVPEDSTDFYSDRAAVVYGREYTAGTQVSPVRGVAAHMAVDGLTDVAWNLIHFDTTKVNSATAAAILGSDHILYCMLPGDRFGFGDDLTGTVTALTAPTVPGFYALSGVFLEPSFPRPTGDLALTIPHVVDALHGTSTASDVGSRNISDFTGTPDVEEDVHFNIRRVRRWHSVQADIASNLESLQYGYEMRRGGHFDYVPGTRTYTATAPGTNLGAFDDPKVNVHSGDTLRVLDAAGNLIDEAEIETVTGATTLLLRKPGLTASLAAVTTFEVYLSQAIVPHEQSNEQLLSLVTDQVVVKRVVDYAAGDTVGGQVPVDFDKMKDDTPGFDFVVAGAQEGDYVLVDPSGPLYESDENGAMPTGDISVVGRAPYKVGGPSDFDDNRGFYKIVDAVGDELTVDGASRFGGGSDDGSDNEVFGDPGAEYAVLPVVSGSVLTDVGGDPLYPFLGKEGQQTMRPTAAPVGTSYRDRTGFAALRSIQPFSYTIIRPSPIFSEDSLELVLFIRERMLSFIEEAKAVYETGKGGDYYVFQQDDHITDIGSPTDAGAGLGIVSNLLISSLQGLVDEKPYANVADCLSVLGRRFWILDFRLDEDGYSSFVEDGFGQRPVLPDLIEDVLDLDDRFRDLRYSWIRFRADRVNGSITEARRAVEALPDELAKQQELISQRKALSESEDS